MSKPSARANRRKTTSRKPPVRSTSDRSIYFGLTIIGGMIVLLSALITAGMYWREFTLGYIIVMAFLINLFAIAAYRGKHMANWKMALARLPLHFAGYGSKHGKPIEAAHGSPSARRAIVLSIIISIIVLIVLSFVLVDELRSLLLP